MYFKFGRPNKYLDVFSFDLVAAPSFEGVAFPIIRRVFSRLLSQDLVSVQPLPPPNGILDLLYGMEFKIKTFKFGRKWKQ